MKTNIQKLSLLVAAGILAGGSVVQAASFAGNGSTAWGGAVGTGSLTVTDNGTNLTFTLVPNGSNLGGNGVAVYIDTGTGGFTDTSGFNDATDGGHSVVSGYTANGNGGNPGQSVITFASGFKPSYAVSFGDGYTSLFQLGNGGNGSIPYITGEGTTPYSFTFPAADLGLTPGSTATIRIFGSLCSQTGYRSPEAIAGNYTGNAGWNPFTQTAFATYVFDPATIPTNNVTFQVDMTEQVALGTFNPANGDTVNAAGTFQTSPWSGFQLTNNPNAANTNLYTGTYPDNDAAGTVEQYKYTYTSAANSTTTYENITTINNRSFVLQSGGQVLQPSYFSNIPASPSATTNTTVFQIDLTPQIYLNNFKPANGDQIEVFGSFEASPWTAGFILTNNPTSAQSNIYSGSFTDGNYPGTQYQYKFVIVSGSTDSYESTDNRNLVTPTNFATLPVVYFNNASNVYSTPVTFQVDMTGPIEDGALNLANGDTVSAAGTFQSSLSANQWIAGTFVLTNNPSAANTNIFTGTFIDVNAPGTGEEFKFQINPGGNGANANWESVQNRFFPLSSTAQTLPLVFWNDQDPNNIVLEPTTVTFTVDMTGAVDVFGYPFNPTTDDVIINGPWANPAWYSWTDPLLGFTDYTQYVLTGNTSNLLYTGTFTLPEGSPLQTVYKYGIVHNAGNGDNTNADNEAAANLNHTRYIRAVGTYNFPVDIFGIQNTNQAAATEPSVGSLSISAPVAGQLPISWLGRPGVYLQYSTNLAGPWIQLNSSGGASSSSWAQTNGTAFFRLVNP